MGILFEPAEFVRSLKLPRGFSVCELGDQYVTYIRPKVLAKDFFTQLGCGRYESIDGNGRGTVLHDLNRSIDVRTFGTFDLVTDFGTGEHIFDQARLWRNIHNLTKPGGYIAFDRPSQGYRGHCFYLVDECWFNDIAAANNYGLKLQRGTTTRGELWRGYFQKPLRGAEKFRVPQQGRYHKILEIPA